MGALHEVTGRRNPRRHAPSRHGLTSLDDIKPLYFLPKDDLAEEALIPSFRAAEGVDCMVGFSSSASLATLAPGLATFINETSGRLRLIVSPYLSAADQAAIEAGAQSPESAAADAFERMIVTEDLLQRHALRCISYLMRVGRIDLRIAVMKDALFHPKVWLFGEAGNTLAVHGSGNMTEAGIRRNFEQITVSRAWADPTQRYLVDKLAFQFGRLWDNLEDDCVVLTAPQAVAEKILQAYPTGAPPTEAEYRALHQRAAKAATARTVTPSEEPPAARPEEFSIPARLRYDDGPFEHQGRAVRTWCEAGYRGVLEMATGSGKTITAMVGSYRLFEQQESLLIVVAAPYVPLIEQWCDEIEPFGLKPVRPRSKQLDCGICFSRNPSSGSD